MRRTVGRRLVGTLAAGIALALTWTASGVPAAAAEDPRATASATWLVRELERGGGTLPAPVGEAPDLGLTADAIIAISLAGDAPAARPATDAFFAGLSGYTSWDDLGSQFSGVRLAGPWAKALLVAVVQGLGTSDVGTRAETELRSLMQAAGDQAGRFSDDNPHGADESNGFGQAVGVAALARTPDGVPAAAIDYLLAQQCPDGGFRLFYGTSASCDDPAQSDSDTTAMTVQALLGVPPSPDIEAAVARAVAWLQARQDAGTGAFGGTGPTDAPNANSTGVAAQALRAAGALEAADRAAAWVSSLQLQTGGDAGAIAYDEASRDTAVGVGIGDIERDQWRRSTAQAILALGLPAVVPPVPQGPGTSTTTTAPPASTTSSTTSTTAAAPSSTETVPTVLGQQLNAPDGGSSSAAGRRRSTTGLAGTGADVLVLAGAGAASAAGGAALVVAARRRRS